MAKRASYRTDSTLGKLPEARQLEIAEYYESSDREGDRAEATATWLREDGIKVGRSALWSWYQSYSLARDFAEAEAGAEFAMELEKEANSSISAEELEAVGQKYFARKALATRDSKEWREMEYLKLAKESAKTKARQKDSDLALANRRVTVMEKKLEQIEAVANDATISTAEQAQRIREIFKK